MALRPLPGYSQPVGAKIEWKGDLDGPSSYVNSGTFNTSGQVINASDYGLGGFEEVASEMISSDGLNVVRIVPGATLAPATNLQPAPPSPPALAFVTAVLHWYVLSTGLEVANGTDLSGKYVRLSIRGI